MQQAMDHFEELHELLRSGSSENIGRQTRSQRATRNPPALFTNEPAAPGTSRPPRIPGATGPAPRARRLLAPPPAPVAPPLLAPAEPLSRPPASRNDVSAYLSQRAAASGGAASLSADPAHNPHPHHQQQQHQYFLRHRDPAPAHPAPAEHRRAKRGKPMARRSLQALFDAAAEDTSTWQTSVSVGDDTEDDADNVLGAGGGMVTTSAAVAAAGTPASPATLAPGGDGMGPSTPANCDSGVVAPAARPGPSAALDGPGGVDGAPPAEVPLTHLLMSDRGQRLTALEAKAIVLRVAEDLAALHAANGVHRRVGVSAVTLTPAAGADGVAVATLRPARGGAAAMGPSRCHWAPRDPSADACAPPEVACCPPERLAAFTPAGDMWGLGAVLFAVLAAGRLPFGPGGVRNSDGSGGIPPCALTMDELQRRLQRHLETEIAAVNASAATAAGAKEDLASGSSGSDEEMMAVDLEARAVGFDPGAESLLLGLLRADPAQRLTAADVVSHPWLAEAAPLVPAIPAKALAAWAAAAIRTGPRREASPSFATGPASRPGTAAAAAAAVAGQNGAGLSAYTAAAVAAVLKQRGEVNEAAAAAAEHCPYPIIGHVAQPMEVTVGGQKVTVSALHAVYAVPGHGAMMSAAPVALADPAEVSAAATAATGDAIAPLVERLLREAGADVPAQR